LIRYDDAMAYCGWLSGEIGRAVRLPTEAEWEKASRAGAEALKYPWGNEIDSSRANYLTDPATKPERGTRPTGTYPPNAYGLYDMCGNVWEWASDWYSAEYYGVGEMRDPRGPASGLRGGSRRSWVNQMSMLRNAHGTRCRPTRTPQIQIQIVCAP
jgi:formylglycine-generating enzyme required for sulfatase activity